MKENNGNRGEKKTAIFVIIAVLALIGATLPAAASDYTLGVFGNANEDDTVNMQDVTYTELIILEYRDRTELADAKYDDKINMQDVTQIELIILGKEKETTLLNAVGGIVTLEKPIRAGLGDMGTTEKFIISYYPDRWDFDKIVCLSADALCFEGSKYEDFVYPLPYFCQQRYGPISESIISETKPNVFILSVEEIGEIISKEGEDIEDSMAEHLRGKLSRFVTESARLGVPIFLANFTELQNETLVKHHIMNS